MIDDRWLCGWRVASEVPLPDLVPWSGDDRAPDIAVRLGDVPECVADPVHVGPVLQVAADGTCRFAIAGIAAYLVEGGRLVTVQPEMDPAAPDVRLLLLGSVFSFLCHQRQLLPLHAGCVEIDGRAVAFAGQSGAGKSTLTAAFAQRSYPVLGDDVTVVDVAAPGGPHVLPAFPRLKLWRNTIDGLRLSAEGLERSRTGLEKFNMRFGDGFPRRPLPLAKIYILETVNDVGATGIGPLRGIALVSNLFRVIHRRMMAIHAGRRSDMMSAITVLATKTPVSKLSRMHEFASLDATVDAIVGLGTAPESGAA